MRTVVLILAMLVGSLKAFGTVDAHTRVYLVVKDIQTEEFFIERAPIIGCYGLARGPQLAQFTAEYKVNANVGCGDQFVQENINYLTCAKVVSSVESPDYLSFSEITLDITGCPEKNSSIFRSIIRRAARLNFPLNRGSVKVKFIR
ncbi:hypothetical protein [Bdellovibrio reynosensis]|uniref:Uncharacterized protein n=1 Tax=Bdellovibrio reynosensis TaxID=2835041 RepID=A0ABY4CD49_9BACT|nr:hypothetical protein [Bdellovibrio reynosensis]UOF01646.1 hypothetical protein MNR06_01600 [Bdellovibrio reynosensis]